MVLLEFDNQGINCPLPIYTALSFAGLRWPTLPHEVEHSLETPQAVSTVLRPGILAENNTPNFEGGWV